MKFLVLAIISLFVFNCFSQNKLSNNALLSLDPENGLMLCDNGNISALALVNEKANDSVFKANGITINGKFGKVWSIMFPLTAIQTIQNLAGIQYIEMATRTNAARFKNDLERQMTSVDKVQNGLQNALPMNYSGKGVIVGIVDIGFQGNNPTFFNNTGSKSRIIKWWQQSNKNGTPPAGYSYGTEITDSTQIINANDNDGIHGTHVAGIAAGSGYTTPNLQYRGMAPEADLVFVSIKYANDTLGGSALGDYLVANPTILDAYKYIFDYAQSVGKPAVINLSWGMHTGPHDGTSLFDLATESLVGKGKVLVGANGNEGDNPMHWHHLFNSDTVGTMAIENNRQNKSNESVYADFWGSANTDFSMQISILDTNKNLVVQTPFVSSTSNKVNVYNLSGDSGQFKIIMACAGKNPVNNKPNITLMADESNPKKFVIVVKITSANSDVHGWNSGSVREWTDGTFRMKVGKVDFSSSFITGNIDYTNGENGGTSKAVISVGALAARSSFMNINGKWVNDSGYVWPGFITRFSSKGPTVDGRIKPDVSAPGYDVPSSVNNKQIAGWELDKALLKTVFRNDTNFWVALNGTSMASPHVCGIVALMLQAYPDLTADDVKTILHQTATKNLATGNVPNNQYGYGIVNAYEAVKMAIQYAHLNSFNTIKDVNIFPNPAGNVLNVKYSYNPDKVSYCIYGTEGRLVGRGDVIQNLSNISSIDVSALSSGLYILEFNTGGQFYKFKFFRN